MNEAKSPQEMGRDKTPRPTEEAWGNTLRHTEDCAFCEWRFGGACDCRDDPQVAASWLADRTYGPL